MKPSIHITSGIKHDRKWQDLKAKPENSNIISEWFTDLDMDGMGGLTQKEKIQFSKKCLQHAMQADFTILYCEPGDVLSFPLVQVGAAIAAGKTVLIVGECESVTSALKAHPNCINTCNTIHKALLFINKQ